MNKKLLAALAVAVLVILGVYLISPFSKSTQLLRVFINQEKSSSSIGYRAMVVNQGLLPVFVDTCDSVGEGVRTIHVPDAIQRLEGERWRTALDRRGCYAGARQKKFSPKLLWPRQTMSATYFFPNVGFPGFPFKHGDQLRFLVFIGTGARGAEVLTSPAFTIE